MYGQMINISIARYRRFLLYGISNHIFQVTYSFYNA